MQPESKSPSWPFLLAVPAVLASFSLIFIFSGWWNAFFLVLGMASMAIPWVFFLKPARETVPPAPCRAGSPSECKVDPDFLLRHSFFGGLTREDAESIGTLFEIDDWPAGMDIMTEGSPGSRVYFIMEGQVEIRRKDESLAVFKAGEIVGEMEFLDVMPAAATVRAVTPVRTAALTGKSLHSVYKRNPQAFSFLMMNLARDLARRLRKMDELLTEGN